MAFTIVPKCPQVLTKRINNHRLLARDELVGTKSKTSASRPLAEQLSPSPSSLPVSEVTTSTTFTTTTTTTNTINTTDNTTTKIITEVRDATVGDIQSINEIYNYYVCNTTTSFETQPLSVSEMNRRRTQIQHQYNLPFLVHTTTTTTTTTTKTMTKTSIDTASTTSKHNESDLGSIYEDNDCVPAATTSTLPMTNATTTTSASINGYAYATKWKIRDAYRHVVESTVYVRQGCHGMGIGRQLYQCLLHQLRPDLYLLPTSSSSSSSLAEPNTNSAHKEQDTTNKKSNNVPCQNDNSNGNNKNNINSYFNYTSVMATITLPNNNSVRFHESMNFTQVALYEKVGYKFDRWIDVGTWQLQLL